VYGVGFLVGGAPRFVVLAVTGALVPVLGVVLVAEVFSGLVNPVIGATTYERIPERLRTRVLGMARASAWVGVPIGPLVGGYAVEVAGLRPALLAFAGLYLATTLAPFVFPAWRGMRRPGENTRTVTGEPAGTPPPPAGPCVTAGTAPRTS
jgi:MFS family permease